MVAKFVENDGDPRKVFSNYIAPRIQAATRGEEPIGRIHSMNETKLADFARKRGLDCRVQQGEADFTQLRVRLKQLIVEGWVIGFKLPGEDPEHCEMLHPDSIKFLSSKDLFVFSISPVGASLLRKFGGFIGTDTSHKTLSYSAVKVTAVGVSSWKKSLGQDHDKPIKERGFTCATILCTSDRDDVQKAVVVHLKQAVEESAKRAGLIDFVWTPRILMSGLFNSI